MNECLNTEIQPFCNLESIENIYTNYKTIVGVMCNTDIINEHNKYVGRVLLVVNTKKISLGIYVEFNKDKIKWRSSKFNEDGNGFYLIDPYWCKKYIAEPKINIPIKVYKPKTDTFEIELVPMFYKQFIKRRLLDLYGDWRYRIIASIENYDKNRHLGHWAAINYTVKHYHIDVKCLNTALAKRNKYLSTVNNEWRKLCNDHYQQNESAKKLSRLVKTYDLEMINDNVIKMN